ncbi:rnp-1 like rna-binding protein [Nannochloropsis gaditana]|uniref:Rnp-1 like rna-binding protein n=1 Tax=Nannochloropsis gaditana TaxID=72520 RepID=W7TWE7_9STRA|nr:rnp-1 like rna-binding protein [Nannochloropsis gaditana]
MNEDTSGTGEAYDPFAQPYLPALPPAHDAPDSQAPPEAPVSLDPTRGDSSSPPRASGVSGATMDHKGKRLYVGQLSFDTTDREIRDIFSKIGSLRYCRIMTDKGTNKSRGFAFVGFSTRAAAQKAMQMWDNRELNGRRLKIRLAEPRAGEGEGGADEGGVGREDRAEGGVRGANGDSHHKQLPCSLRMDQINDFATAPALHFNVMRAGWAPSNVNR